MYKVELRRTGEKKGRARREKDKDSVCVRVYGGER